MNKDEVKGAQRALFVCNGATGHSRSGDRANLDYYASDPVAGEWLLELEPQINNIWECAVGEGHLAEAFRKAGKLRVVSDLIDRGYYPKNIPTKYDLDFLQFNKVWRGDIVTNPPYCSSLDWAEHQLDLIQEGRYSALFMKITFLEGKERRKFFEKYPPIRVWVSSSRIMCCKNGDFDTYGKKSSAACYCWFVWQKGYTGETTIKWFN